MLRTMAKSLAALVLCAPLMVCAAQAGEISPAPVISDSAGAIAMAYAIWYAGHPDRRAGMPPAAVWEADMDARLENGLWRVDTKPPSDPTTLRGSLHFVIAPQDGRLIDFFYVPG